jgi:thiamine pyrophosphate-dependent acetolactate synthase large subunit-like protein
MTTGPLTLAGVAGAVAAARDEAIVVTGPGAMSGTLYAVADEPGTLYNMELAYAAAVACGIALQRPEEAVIGIEGDGSLLAGIGILATIARYRPQNLTVVCLVNGIYGTGDNSVRTQTALGADYGAVAVGLGWDRERVRRVGDAEALASALTTARREPGPWLVLVDLDPAAHPVSAGRVRPGIDVVEAGILVRRELARRAAER